MSSRLFTSLREKNGLSYNISCDVSLYKDAGIIYISTSFDKDSLILKNINDIKYCLYDLSMFIQNNLQPNRLEGFDVE